MQIILRHFDSHFAPFHQISITFHFLSDQTHIFFSCISSSINWIFTDGRRDGGTEERRKRHLALFVPGRIRIGRDRSGQVRTGQNRSGQVRASQDRTDKGWSGQVRTGQVSGDQDMLGQVKTGQNRSGELGGGQDR